jgi:predicted Zn-dependent protease with MMP-like domain
MDAEKFEEVVEQAFHHLPPLFKKKMENVEIIVEDEPSESEQRSVGVGGHSFLLGLYHGIPLTQRGTWYGMTPVLPDRISIYRKNIQKICSSDEEIKFKIYEVLCHEIGHYFGMDEHQIRNAMRAW